jgi:exosome complex component RRP43
MSNEGYVVPNFELSPVSSPNVHPGPPSEQEQVISQFLSDLVNKYGGRCAYSHKHICLV